MLQQEDEDNFPKIMKIFLNQKYTITLNITEENTKKSSKVYTAYEIAGTMDVSDSFNPTANAQTEVQDMSSAKVRYYNPYNFSNLHRPYN